MIIIKIASDIVELHFSITEIHIEEIIHQKYPSIRVPDSTFFIERVTTSEDSL